MSRRGVLSRLAAAFTVLTLLILLYNTSADNARLRQTVQECRVQWRSLYDNYSALEGAYTSIQLQLANLTQAYERLKENNTLLREAYTRLNISYTDLQAEYRSSEEAYKSLKTEHDALLQNYSHIISEYKTLSSAYSDLETSCERLKETLENINRSYTLLYQAFYEPLTNKTVPTVQELKNWLAEDKVDQISYVYPDFVCGDYAVMLAFHAKLKGWDMGVVTVVGHYPDRREFNHAFNAIKCREGLVYVEPQTDSVWWNPGYAEIKSESWYTFPDFGRIYIDTIVVAVLY